jgi:WD40 repeat protein
LENRNGNLVSCSADGTICTWNWRDGALIHTIDPAHEGTLEPSKRNGAVRGMVWTDRYMITGGIRDGVVKLWDIESNAPISGHKVGHTAIWNVVGGEGKLAVSSRVQQGLLQVTLWDTAMIDAEGL